MLFLGFPTFPVRGRPHFELMGVRRFPADRQFGNLDLDPYLEMEANPAHQRKSESE